MGYVLVGLTAGLTAFLVISKGAAIVKGMATAFRALNAAIAANPIGAIAVVITAVLIPALIYLFKNWDKVKTYIDQGVARLVFAFTWFGSQIKEKFTTAVNGVKIAFISLAELIVTKVLGAVANLLEVMGRLPFVGEQFNNAARAVRNFASGFTEAANEARESSRATIQAVQDEQQAAREAQAERLHSIDEEARARREALEASRNNSNEEMELETEAANHEIEELNRTVEATQEAENKKSEIVLQSLKQRLEDIALTENQVLNQQIETVKSFMLQRAELESNNHSEQLEFLEQQKIELLAMYEEGSNERIAIERAADEAILESRKKLAQSERQLLEQRLNAFTDFTSGIGSLIAEGGRQSRNAAVAGKMIASAEAAINSMLAFTKALASVPYPYNFIAAGSVLASGLAQQIKIISTPIPSAETGGRFIVPNSTGVDGSYMKVNQGEQVDVTPRGQVGNNESFNFQFLFNGEVFADIINKLAKSGELHTLQLQGNL
jgi:hypothetical protein